MTRPIYQVDHSILTVHRGRYRRRRKRAVVFLIIIAIISGLIIYDLAGLRHQGSNSAVGAAVVKQIAGPQTFRSSYFQFSDTSAWQYAPNDSSANKITYLLYQSGVVADSLTVYVNQTPLPGNLAVTRVLPVQIKDGNSFTFNASVAGPCGNLYGPTELKRIRTQAISGTSILCVPDSPQFSVIVGQTGGNYNLALRRHSGQIANYIIIYFNLTVNPEPSSLLRIMKTFQAI